MGDATPKIDLGADVVRVLAEPDLEEQPVQKRRACPWRLGEEASEVAPRDRVLAVEGLEI